MIKVGITGGIGSGKTTVCNIFRTLNVPVYSADIEARILTDEHPEIIKGVCNLFGDEIYINSKLDRKRVGELVFIDKVLLRQLNNIIHPIVAQHFKNWLEKNKNKKYILKEAAILFESGGNKQVDKVIAVSAPKEVRIKRVIKRDQLKRQEVIDRINNQMPDEDKVKLSDFVIYCDDSELVIPQVVALHNQLLM